MELKEQYPHCTMSNPNRYKILIGTMLTMILTQIPTERFFKSLFYNKILRTDKFPLGSELRINKAKMLGERVFRLINYLLCTSFLMYTLNREDCDFLDVRIGGTVDYPLYYKNYPC